jgi:hypothetical protein
MRSRTRALRAGLGAALLVGLPGCSSEAVTSARVEAAVAPTFANLVHLQLELLSLPTPPASSLRVKATCHKVGVGVGTSGAGDWTCNLLWFGAESRGGARRTLEDRYELTVGTDGCYTATADAEAHVGGATLTTSGGATVTNLLYAFDGCFDTT